MRYPMGTGGGSRCTERTGRGGRPSSCTERQPAPRCARLSAAIIALVTALACGGRDDPSATAGGDAGSSRIGASPRASTGASAPAKPICPATGAWQVCNIVERLERAGLAPRRESATVAEPPLAMRGIVFLLGRSELRIFLYPSRVTRERDQARLDSTEYLSATQPMSMQPKPTVIASENLLAILRSRSDHQRERVSDALTAGPPQPPQTNK